MWLRRGESEKKETREDYLKLFSESPCSYSDKFQDIPLPLPPYAPELLAARWILHDLRYEQWPDKAVDLLEAGYDTPSLRVLSGEIGVTSSAEIEPRVARMFKEMNVPYPVSEKLALHLFACQIARQVIAGTRNLWCAAGDLAFLARLAHWENPILNCIDQCIDAIDIDPEWRPSTERLNADLIDLVAELARAGQEL